MATSPPNTTSFHHSYHYKSNEMKEMNGTAIGVSHISCFVIGFIANGCLLYQQVIKRRLKRSMNISLALVALSNMATVFLYMFSGISHVSGKLPHAFKNDVFRNLWGVLEIVNGLWMGGLISLPGLANITRLSKTVPIVWGGGTFIYLLIAELFPLCFGVEYLYFSEYSIPFRMPAAAFPGGRAGYEWYVIVTSIGLCGVFWVILGTILTINILLAFNPRRTNNPDGYNVTETIMVLAMMITYVLLDIPAIIMNVDYVVAQVLGFRDTSWFDYPDMHILLILWFIFTTWRAALLPIIALGVQWCSRIKYSASGDEAAPLHRMDELAMDHEF